MRTLFYCSLLLVCAIAWDITIPTTYDLSSKKLPVSITNDSPQKSFLLKWRSPFDELEGLYSFVITKNGNQMEYKGPVALRLAPRNIDFLSFEPGQTRDVTVNLTKAFDFEEVGWYQVQIVMKLLDGDVLKSNVVDIDVTVPTKVNVRVYGPEVPYISYVNCTATHRNVIDPAWGEFGVAAGLMLSAVYDNPQNNALYRTWFGIFANNRYATVTDCITNLEADFHTNGKEFYCNPSGCSPGVVAYVSSGAPNTIHVCQLYFQLSNRDHIFVIVHEELHFGAICGAPDYVYGRQGSMQLAINNPNNAVMNSDNYRFYGEDLYYGNTDRLVRQLD